MIGVLQLEILQWIQVRGSDRPVWRNHPLIPQFSVILPGVLLGANKLSKREPSSIGSGWWFGIVIVE